MDHLLRPAKLSDATFVHAQLKAALAETFSHAPAFIAHEVARFSPDYLCALITANPSYVFIAERGGNRLGFILSGPEQGNLFYYWGYMDPAHRKGALAISLMAQFVKYWDNRRFHKITAYTTPGNRVAQLLMQRNGFQLIAKLDNHIYGESFLQYEKPLNKALPGYDKSVFLRRRQVLTFSIKRRLGWH